MSIQHAEVHFSIPASSFETHYSDSESPGCHYSDAQLCPTLYDPVGCSPPGSSVREIVSASVLE